MSTKSKSPLVSVIVPTLNSAPLLERCLQSIVDQVYPYIELIVVDNPRTTDNTKEIAARYTAKVFECGPERSAQVNFGVTQAKGKYIYKVDSDFILDKHVVEHCVDQGEAGYDAVIVHNSPDIRISWIARIRKFEVDMYKYDLTHSSARFVRRDVYQAIGGFNEKITAGEDYDFQNKLNRGGYKTGFIAPEALHLGEPKSFWRHMKKYYQYGRDFTNYTQHNQAESKAQLSFLRSVYVKHWRRFVAHPLLAGMFIFYNCCKYAFGALGYAVGRLRMRSRLQPVATPPETEEEA